MEDWEVYVQEAVAAGRAAREEGIAQNEQSDDSLRRGAELAIRGAREQLDLLVRGGAIPLPPEG
jgi:hypothetical protein